MILRCPHCVDIRLLAAVAYLVLSASIISCESREQKSERLAKTYCGSCHIFPQPGLLDKSTWEKGVLPAMKFRMGFADAALIAQIPFDDLNRVLQSVPSRPMISEEEFALIEEYYLRLAPDSLDLNSRVIAEKAEQFTAINALRNIPPYVTMMEFDSTTRSLFVGLRSSWLYRVDHRMQLVDSVRLPSTPADVQFNWENLFVTTMGIMDPNDQAKGGISKLNYNFDTVTPIIDSLQRPVYALSHDFNGDGREEHVVCAYGNFTGQLMLYEMSDNGKRPLKHIVSELPGARKVFVRDFDKDGREDLLALISQGDEKISIFYNKGNFDFEEKILLRFPPVYGSNSIELVDFDGDGSEDILMTNGDNADYSIVFKPYHAVRLFVNDGNYNFTEKWSYPMHGASQAKAADFDKDGDIDIAAISFFPDYLKTPEQGFLYFRNDGGFSFTPQIIREAAFGRWLVMETDDIDADGDDDIMLGAFNFSSVGNINRKVAESFTQGSPVLLLENKAGRKPL